MKTNIQFLIPRFIVRPVAITLRLVLLPEKASLCKLSVSIHIIFVLHILHVSQHEAFVTLAATLLFCYSQSPPFVVARAQLLSKWSAKSSTKHIIFTMIDCRPRFSINILHKERYLLSCAAIYKLFRASSSRPNLCDGWKIHFERTFDFRPRIFSWCKTFLKTNFKRSSIDLLSMCNVLGLCCFPKQTRLIR